MWQEIGQLFAIFFVIVLVSFFLLWLIGVAMKDSSIVDIWWGLGLAVLSVVGYFVADGVAQRQLLITVLMIIWGVRLGGYIGWRNWGAEDRRYARLRKHIEDQGRSYAIYSLTRINGYQGMVMWVMSGLLAIVHTADAPETLGPLAFTGVALWIVGLLFETIADAQLSSFHANPDNATKVMDQGLWRYSRHPNYFGELCIWWGYFLIAVETPLGIVAIYAPLLMTYMIMGMLGKALVERRSLKKRPDYQAYIDRTSGIFPWPPKKI